MSLVGKTEMLFDNIILSPLISFILRCAYFTLKRRWTKYAYEINFTQQLITTDILARALMHNTSACAHCRMQPQSPH